jgi:serine/threonine protein kinase
MTPKSEPQPGTVPLPPEPEDPRVLRAVEEYQAAWKAGRRPERGDYLARHADIAPALAECLDGLDFIQDAAPRLQESAGALAAAGAALAGAGPAAGTLGDYRLLREVGRGGMGVVYEAEQTSLGRRVALKVLPFAAALDARRVLRFQSEARAAACLHHTHIVPVYAVGCERAVHYYAMQFIDGQTLAALLHQLRRQAGRDEGGEAGPAGALAGVLASGRWAPPSGPATTAAPAGPRTGPPSDKTPPLPADRRSRWEVPRAPSTAAPAASPWGAGFLGSAAYFRAVAQLGVQAAEALEHAHALGVVHRDIKPSNLLVDGQGQLWVTDFGLAQVQSDTRLTLSGDLVGTLRYMSPEQALAERVVLDHRTDIYSLGVTLYELLTLEPAFPGTSRQEVLLQVAFAEPAPPRRLNRAVPWELETIVLRAMAKEPAERYATAQGLADDLERFLGDRPIQARRPSLPQRLWKWARRHKTVAIATGLAGLLLLLVTVSLLAVNNVLIQAEQGRTGAERDRAQAALAAEGEQRRLAEANLRLALQALDEVFLTPAEAEVFGAERQRRSLTPEHLERVDRTLLQKGLAFYEQFAEGNRASTLLQGETGKAHERAGRIHMILGQYDKAEVALRRAIAMLEKVDEARPPGADCRRQFADACHLLGETLKHSGRAQEAEGFLRKDVAVSEKLVAEFPMVPSDRLHLCAAYIALGDLLRTAGRPQEAIQFYLRALDVAQRITADFPALDDASSYEARQRLGDLLRNLNCFREAEQPYRQNLDLARQLVADSPTVADHWQKLALSQSSLARLYIHADQLAKAEQVYREGIALGERMAARFPDVASYQDGPAWSHVGLGDVLWVRGRYAAAAAEYQRAVTFKPDYADGHWKLAWFLANCPEVSYRDPVRAVEAAKRALALSSQDGHYWKALGVASYRAGNWGVAVEALERANWFCAGGGSYEWFPLAMAHWRRGEKELARQWYAKACQWMEDHEDPFAKEPGFFWDEELRRFRDEAAHMLGITAGP